MIYKLLITYDIPEDKDNERYEVNKYLEQSEQWVHLQKSVWIILSKLTAEETYQLLRTISNLYGSFSVVDVTHETIFCNDSKDCSKPDGYLILNSNYLS